MHHRRTKSLGTSCRDSKHQEESIEKHWCQTSSESHRLVRQLPRRPAKVETKDVNIPLLRTTVWNLAPGLFCEMVLTIVRYALIYTYTYQKCLYHRCLPPAILVGTSIYFRTRTSCSWFARLPSLSVYEVKHCRAVFQSVTFDQLPSPLISWSVGNLPLRGTVHCSLYFSFTRCITVTDHALWSWSDR